MTQKQLLAKANLRANRSSRPRRCWSRWSPAGSHARGGHRRRQCHSRRHRLHHAVAESAMGKYPEESVAMLARIAAVTEGAGRRPPG